jgi:hypothetical protein
MCNLTRVSQRRGVSEQMQYIGYTGITFFLRFEIQETVLTQQEVNGLFGRAFAVALFPPHSMGV